MNAMKGDQSPRQILRKDYQPPAWRVETVVMTIELDATTTRVTSSLRVRRNPVNLDSSSSDSGALLELHGAGLETHSVAVDGHELAPSEYSIDGELMQLELDADTA